MIVLAWWAGCTSNTAVPGDAYESSEEIPSSPTDPPTASSPTTDLELLQQLLDGELPVDEVVQSVAWSGGWPVRDGDSLWFVLRDAGPGPWSVAGDFSAWEPIPMNDGSMTAGAGFWWAQVEGAATAGSRYKFVSGESWVADPLARSYTYDAYGEISYAVAPSDLPRLDRWPQLQGQDLAPRDLAVYVPAGEGPWPVLYAHDGQNLFDPNAIWGGWRLQEALAARGPLLVVGIFNTADRMDEYTHVEDDIGEILGGRGDAYAALVEEDLRPHIEAVYGSTGLDGVMGSSLGGLISLHVVQRYPGRYDFAASLSGTLGWGRFAMDNETMQERWLAAPPLGTAIYVDSGGEAGGSGCVDSDGDGFTEDDPDASDNYCESRQFVDTMAAAGFVWDEDLWHWWEPGAEHNEAAWAERVGMPLDLFLAL
jgi:hypothetical protein